ncbi:hypothetical protein [Vibrio phage phiKT1019]|nr:hypothetical protein [Vibrio phage phiKT1019]
MKVDKSLVFRVVTGLIMVGLSLFIAWCAIGYKVLDTQGYVTDVFLSPGSSKKNLFFTGKVTTISSGDSKPNYDYFIRTEVDLFKCTLNEEQHQIINGERNLRVMYGEYPTGERKCLYVGI